MNENWKLWDYFCSYTKRDLLWSKIVLKELLDLQLLPTDRVLDVGCGSGEFTKQFQPFAKNVLGLDYTKRLTQEIPFLKGRFEDFSIENQTLLIFKQSIHLIESPFRKLEKATRQNVVLIQMGKPVGETGGAWDHSPLNPYKNAELLRSFGRKTKCIEKTLKIHIPEEIHKELVMGGYTSNLQKLSKEERSLIWRNSKRGVIEDRLVVVISEACAA